MATLTQSPFNLIFNELVIVQVTAINSYGPSTPSIVNSDGARVRRKPSQIPSISVIAFSDTSASLSWTDLEGTETGNSDLTSYQLNFDDATGATY